MDLCCLLWETVLISCSLLKVVMYFCDKLVCFWKHKNTQAWLMTRVKAWEGQNTGRKSVICLTLALTQKVIRLQEVLRGMTGQSICNNINNGDDNVAAKKLGWSPIFYLYGALLGDEAISIPQRRKYCNFSIFLCQTPLVHHDEFYPKAKRVFHHYIGFLHILRNHFWGSRETPPPLCNIIINWEDPSPLFRIT